MPNSDRHPQFPAGLATVTALVGAGSGVYLTRTMEAACALRCMVLGHLPDREAWIAQNTDCHLVMCLFVGAVGGLVGLCLGQLLARAS